VGQDEKNSSRYLVHLYQGGLRLQDRDYYFDADSGSVRIRAEYAKHVTAMFRLLGEDEKTAAQSSQTVVGIETRLARRSRTIEQRRDPWANYNKKSLADLKKLTPSIDWTKQFADMGIPKQDTVIVEQPEF